jgi:hypothetical protein
VAEPVVVDVVKKAAGGHGPVGVLLLLGVLRYSEGRLD